MPSFYPEDNVGLAQDNELRTLHKILGVLNAGGAGNGSVITGHFGGAAPPSSPTPTNKGAIAYDLDPPNAVWNWDTETLQWF
jgi:hypothetical protein